MDNCADPNKLKAQTLVDHTEYDGNAAIPAMDITKDTLASSLSKVQMLEDTHGGLNQDDHTCSQEPNNHMCRNAPCGEEVKLSCNVDTKTHSPYHHCQAEDLDGDVDGRDSSDTSEEGWERQVKGYGAEWVEDEEDDGHHASVRVPFAVEDFDGVIVDDLTA